MALVVTDTTAEWDVVTTEAVGFFNDLNPALGQVEIVYRRALGGVGGWEPYLLVAQSNAMRSIGIVHKGLYALKAFRGPRITNLGQIPGDRIARYGGQVLGTFPNIGSPAAIAAYTSWALEGRGSLLTYRVNPGEGMSVIDGYGSGPPFLYRINDARGTARPVNVRVGQTGYAAAIRPIPAADLQAPNLASIAASELLMNYDGGTPGSYWNLQGTLGQDRNPVIFERRAGASKLELPLLALRL